MNSKLFATALLIMIAGGSFSGPVAHAANVPCEETLKEMRAAKTGASLKDADKAKVDELEVKAVERCNADDDVRSNAFLAEAMKIMGK